ncbi:MAG: hypothetical protein NT031_05745, partial [Planctomycetota bacterium]|nr:hypothetical protein [Planctomycetota bacterium]
TMTRKERSSKQVDAVIAIVTGRTRQRREAQEHIPAGTKIFARKGCRMVGRSTGTFRACTLDGCTGLRVGVRWSNGRLTWPCTKGTQPYRGGYRIV